ncbi:hypothetical protein D1646_03255 [Pseudoflavonifractor sp. 60]|nr:hypothetical protein [Pseudoflavonifractor sp. 60]
MKSVDDGKYLELLALSLDGELSEEERQELEKVSGHEEVEAQLAALQAAFCELEEIPAPEGFAQGVMERIKAETPKDRTIPLFPRPQFRALAGLAACAVLAVGLYGTARWPAEYDDAAGSELLQNVDLDSTAVQRCIPDTADTTEGEESLMMFACAPPEDEEDKEDLSASQGEQGAPAAEEKSVRANTLPTPTEETVESPTAPVGSDSLSGPTAPAGSDSLSGPTAPTGSDSFSGPTAPAGSDNFSGSTAPAGSDSLSDPTNGEAAVGTGTDTEVSITSSDGGVDIPASLVRRPSDSAILVLDRMPQGAEALIPEDPGLVSVIHHTETGEKGYQWWTEDVFEVLDQIERLAQEQGITAQRSSTPAEALLYTLAILQPDT